MKKIRKGDKVLVISGHDKGKSGLVLKVLGERVLVSGVNKVLKHRKPDPDKGIYGGRYEMEKSLHISNISHLDEHGKRSRVGIREGSSRLERVRFLKTTNQILTTSSS